MSELADVSEPLELLNGIKIDPSTGKVIKDDIEDSEYIEVPTNKEAINKITAVRRTLKDLPDIPKNMNVISIILTYTLFGLSDEHIALATDLTLPQISNIKLSEAYSKYNDQIVSTLVKQEQDNVRGIFATHANTAANKLVTLVQSDNDGIALSAVKDLLDRDGHRPADIVEHNHTINDSLEIIYIVKNETEENLTPIIDINVE